MSEDHHQWSEVVRTTNQETEVFCKFPKGYFEENYKITFPVPGNTQNQYGLILIVHENP